MKTQDVINHFGGKQALAAELSITRQAIEQWGDTVPELRAFQIERLTAGQLKVRLAQYRK